MDSGAAGFGVDDPHAEGEVVVDALLNASGAVSGDSPSTASGGEMMMRPEGLAPRTMVTSGMKRSGFTCTRTSTLPRIRGPDSGCSRPPTTGHCHDRCLPRCAIRLRRPCSRNPGDRFGRGTRTPESGLLVVGQFDSSDSSKPTMSAMLQTFDATPALTAGVVLSVW